MSLVYVTVNIRLLDGIRNSIVGISWCSIVSIMVCLVCFIIHTLVSLLTAVSVVYRVDSVVEQRCASLLSLLVYSHSDSALSGARGLI